VLLAVLLPLACRVDNQGLNPTMAVLPHGGDGSADVSVTGRAGGNGTAGDVGAAGTTGAAGDMGIAGDLGGAGTTGAAGDTGTAGATGAAGDIGAAGATGTAGTTGAAGDMGTAGGAGTAGATGIAGTTGTGGGNGIGGSGGAGGTASPTCSPTNCSNGCCDGDQCIRSHSVQQCGNAGAQCAPCANNCETCNDSGACDIKPSSDWTIVCEQAKVAMLTSSGMNWDPRSGAIGGIDPDPFCQFEMPTGSVTMATAGVTDTIVDSFTPVWNETITPMGKTVKAADLMSSSKTWRIWVGDDDGCTTKGGCVGQEICEVDQPLTAGALLSGQLVEKNLMSCLSLAVKFVCAD
jgi:hypothetical protein